MKVDFTKDLKKTWILIFCAVSLMSYLFFAPYDQIHSYKGNITIIKSEQFTIFENVDKKYWSIDYSSMALREIIFLIGCFGGYTLSTMVKK